METGYLEGDPAQPRVTERGELLAGIYSDHDLLVAEAISEGMWSELSPPELAAVVASVVYEGRQRDDGVRLIGAKAEARKKGLAVNEQQLTDGSIKVVVQVNAGGAA